MKVLFIVENAVDSGGNRVIFISIKDSISCGNDVEVAYILRKVQKIKDIFGFFKDYIGMLFKYRNIKIKLLNQPISSDEYDQVITTGRRCLEFLTDLSSKKHVHLIQHLEVWSTFKSKYFMDLSRQSGYATSSETLKCVVELECPEELAYISRLKKVKSFLTVSNYLERILIELNPRANINVSEPPEISYPLEAYAKKKQANKKKYDLLFFIRGLKFKGDELVEEIIKSIIVDQNKLSILVVISGKAKKLELLDSRITYIHKPSDFEMAKLYSESKILINPSLTEGYGAVPREALLYGCKCIASNTGWLQDTNDSGENLMIINKHSKQLYLDAIYKMMND
jgi:glycosyltransferase involved in cell wall biosynthesis